MENNFFDIMLEKNGEKKVIPTILVDGEVMTGYDKARLKEVLKIT